MSGRRYPACISTFYSPEEIKSMAVWDSYCETEPLTLEEIKAANARDSSLVPKRKRKPMSEEQRARKRIKSKEYYSIHPEYMADYRQKHHEEILARQRAYYAAHKDEIMKKKQQRRKEEKAQREARKDGERV